MALCVSPFPLVERICRAGAVALTLAIAAPADNVAAQQPPAKKGAPAPAAAASAGSNSAWVKLCGQTPVGTMYKDGKEAPRYGNFCLTQYERLDGNTGVTQIAVAVRQLDTEDKQYFTITVPLGMKLLAGMRAAFYPAGLWEQAQKNEKIDETKLKGIQLEYKLCDAAGCKAEMAATPEMINDLKTFRGMAVFAINVSGEAAAFPVPLAGFEQAYTGSPTDPKQYVEGRKALMQRISQHQHELAEQQKKQAGKAAPTAAPKK